MAAFFRQRATGERELAARRIAQLREEVPQLAAILRAHGARHVWLFGSLAWGQSDVHADIDLAVEGMPPGAYFGALGELLLRASASVDLVALEDIPEGFARRIRESGLEIEAP